MKRILFVLAAACSIMMLGSGCAAIITGEPIAEKNEFKEASLPGVWLDRDKDIPFYVEDRGDRYIIYSPININGVPFALTKIKSADNSKELKFFCANITSMFKTDPSFPGGDVYLSNAYECSGNKIMVYDLQDNLGKKLRTYYDKRQGRFMIQPAELKRLLAENMDGWQKSKKLYWKAEFKNSRAGEFCVAGIKFFSDYNRELMIIFDLWKKGKINAEQAKQRKTELDAKMRAWRKKYAAANPEFDKIIEKYLPQIDAVFAGDKTKSIKNTVVELNEEYWKKAVQELIK